MSAEVRIDRKSSRGANEKGVSAEVRIGRKSSRGANEKRVSAEVRQRRCESVVNPAAR